MPSIHPSFFFPLCWLPSPQHDHYFSTSYKCNSNVRIRLHELYVHQLREQREKKRKSMEQHANPHHDASWLYNPHAMCVSSQDITMKHLHTMMMKDHSTPNGRNVHHPPPSAHSHHHNHHHHHQHPHAHSHSFPHHHQQQQGGGDHSQRQQHQHSHQHRHPHQQHFHEKKQPSFGDEDTMEMIAKNLRMLEDDGDYEMQDCHGGNHGMTKIHMVEQTQQQQLSLSILAPSSTSTFENSSSSFSDSTMMVQNGNSPQMVGLDPNSQSKRKSSLHYLPIERGEWIKLDTMLLKEREMNTTIISESRAKQQQQSNHASSPPSNSGRMEELQIAIKLVESENELAVDQFDLVVQLCTKMIYSVVTSSFLCGPMWELENEMNRLQQSRNHLLCKDMKGSIYSPRSQHNHPSHNKISQQHQLNGILLRKHEEIYWRKFVEVVFLKLIVDPKVIVVGLAYFEKVIRLLENERMSNSPLLRQHQMNCNSEKGYESSFNRNELKTIMCICIMLASKMYDEDNYWKSKTYFKLFSSLCRKREDNRRITFKEFNQLEVEILNVLQFHLVLNMDEFSREIVQKFMKVNFEEHDALLMI
nr:unnamed protein product [Naegleria fowleri]